jgi:threonine dehydratase
VHGADGWRQYTEVTTLETYPDQVTLADVQAAADCLIGVAMRTPLLAFGPFDDEVGDARVWLKPENLQPIGAFKIRGAYNALATLSPQEKERGVVTHSSGNHAQGVARAARMLGMRAVIVMPEDAPAIKIAGVRADGAEIEFVGADNEARIARADEIAAEQGLVLIPSFDDARIVAGQGTVGLEIVEEWPEVDTVLVPVGGGGLAAGVSVAVRALRPEARIFGVEPEGGASMKAALEAGRTVVLDRISSIADGLVPVQAGELTFRHIQRLADGVVTVPDDEIRRATAFLVHHQHLVVEFSGAATTAAIQAGAVEVAGRNVAVVISGGNLDPTLLPELT